MFIVPQKNQAMDILGSFCNLVSFKNSVKIYFFMFFGESLQVFGRSSDLEFIQCLKER